MLWLQTFVNHEADYLVVQHRFQPQIWTYRLEQGTKEPKWFVCQKPSGLSDPHNGFCTGHVMSRMLVAPQGESGFALAESEDNSETQDGWQWNEVAQFTSDKAVSAIDYV